MNFLQIVNLGLEKGLMGILNGYLKEQKEKTTPNKNQIQRLRLSVKFAPLLKVVDDRLISTITEKTMRPKTTDDTVFKDHARNFFTMLKDVEIIIANSREKEFSNCSVWLSYVEDVRTSNYFKLEICNKDGKTIVASASIHNLLT